MLKPIFRNFLKKSNWNKISKIDILLVDHDGHRSFNYGGKMYAPLIDSIQDSFEGSNFKFLTVAEPYSILTGSKAYGNVVDFNGAFARASIFRKLKLIFKKETYPGEFGYSYVWEKILNITEPKLIISIMPCESLCFASRTRKILIADLQHGVIADNHPWYGQSFKNNVNDKLLPNYYLCWNQESADVLHKWTKNKDIQVRVIGNPWFIKFNQNVDLKFFDRNTQLISFKKLDNLPTILVTLSWDFMQYNTKYFTKKYSKNISFEQEAGFSLGLLKIIKDNHLFYNWKIRLHPVQMNGIEYNRINKFLIENLADYQNVDWIECSKLPLPFVLENIDLHITFTSTIVSEAALFGIRSAILVPYPTPDEWLKSYYENERKNGLAYFVNNNEKDILNWILTNLYSQKKLEYKDKHVKYYYNFIESIKILMHSEN